MPGRTAAKWRTPGASGASMLALRTGASASRGEAEAELFVPAGAAGAGVVAEAGLIASASAGTGERPRRVTSPARSTGGRSSSGFADPGRLGAERSTARARSLPRPRTPLSIGCVRS